MVCAPENVRQNSSSLTKFFMLNHRGNFLRRKNDSTYRDVAPLELLK